MSGIFKGDSIYKSGGGGGGGGGYSDGGQLVDGDYIEVENNTVSSYDNVSRDPVNFYFELSDGEVLNSIIELTTAVNATINVYYVKNGFYYLLGNVGGNTVNAGEDYKVNITGDSYAIETVNNLDDTPKIADINGNLIGVWGFNDWLITDDLGQWFTYTEFENLVASSGWEKLDRNFIDSIISVYGIDAIRSTSGWNNTQGTNTTGLNFYPYGSYQYGSYYDVGKQSEFWSTGVGSTNYTAIWYDSTSASTYGTSEQIKLRVRLRKRYR